jgi:hypothetical protein
MQSVNSEQPPGDAALNIPRVTDSIPTAVTNLKDKTPWSRAFLDKLIVV